MVESYNTKWRTINIDTTVTVPELDAQPVLKLKKAEMPSVETGTWPAGASVIIDKKVMKDPWGRFTLERNYPNPYQDLDLKAHSALFMEWNSDIAENSDILPTEAETIANSLIKQCMSNMESSEYRILDNIVATSAYYHYDDKTNSFSEKLTETGFYSISARQTFYGATLYNRGNYYWKEGKKNNEPYIPTCGISAHIYDEEHYSITFELFREDEIVAEDIPLAPWTQIQKEIEKYILCGNIRDIICIEYHDLGLFNTPEKDGTYYAVPYWAIECYWAEKGKTDSYAFNEPVLIYINAQTGALFDPNSTMSGRNTIKEIITWEQLLR